MTKDEELEDLVVLLLQGGLTPTVAVFSAVHFTTVGVNCGFLRPLRSDCLEQAGFGWNLLSFLGWNLICWVVNNEVVGGDLFDWRSEMSYYYDARVAT